MPYFLLLIFTIFCAYIFDLKYKKSGYNTAYWILCFTTIFVVAIRYKVGIDSMIYQAKFENMQNLGIASIQYEFGYEWLWSAICYVVMSLKGSFISVQLIHAILFNGLLFLFVKKVSSRPFCVLSLFILLEFLYFETEILRESLAVAVFLIAYYKFCNTPQRIKAYLNYYITICIAMLFHNSATFALVVPLIYEIIKSNKLGLQVCTIVAVLLLFSNNAIGGIVQRYLSEGAYEKFSLYQGRSIAGSLYLLQFIKVGIATIVYYSYTKACRISPYYTLVKCGLFMYLLCVICGLPLYGLFSRLANYYAIFLYVAVVDVIVGKRYYYLKYLSSCALGLKLLLYVVSYTSIVTGTEYRYYHKYFPYTTIFNKQEFAGRYVFREWWEF